MKTLTNESIVQLKNEISQNNILKYTILVILFIGIGFLISFDEADKTWNFESLWSSAFQGVVITFVITVFFDFFMKRAQNKQSLLEQELLLSQLSSDLFKKVDVSSLSESEINNLLDKLFSRDDFLDYLSFLLCHDKVKSSSIVNSYLSPFRQGIHLDDVILRSKLIYFSDSQYMWSMTHEFKINDSENKINLLVTKSPEVANYVISSTYRCDHLVLLSDNINSDFDDFVNNNLNISYEVLCNNVWDSRDTIKYEAESSDISSKEKGLLKDSLLLTIEFPNLCKEHRISISYEQLLSVKDPYFYNAATSYVFANEIIIDYSGISNYIGKVSALSFVSSPSSKLTHNESTKEVRQKVYGLLQPGEGALIVWRDKEC